MKDKDMVNKNLDLHYHLMMHLFDDPDSLDIPDGAEVIMLPEHDAELRAANLKLGKKREKAGETVVYVSIRMVPETRTVMVPEVTVVSPAA